MKLTILKVSLFLFCLFIPGSICSETAGQNQQKVLVVYYSRTGHTQLVAEKLAKKHDADLERLVDQKKRTGPAGFTAAGKDAVTKKVTVLGRLKHNPKDYDMILIGGPSWFGNVTPAVRTFIMQNDLTGKKIGLFGLCHLTGVEEAIRQAEDLIAEGIVNKIPTLPLRERELAPEILDQKIDAFSALF